MSFPSLMGQRCRWPCHPGEQESRAGMLRPTPLPSGASPPSPDDKGASFTAAVHSFPSGISQEKSLWSMQSQCHCAHPQHAIHMYSPLVPSRRSGETGTHTCALRGSRGPCVQASDSTGICRVNSTPCQCEMSEGLLTARGPSPQAGAIWARVTVPTPEAAGEEAVKVTGDPQG